MGKKVILLLVLIPSIIVLIVISVYFIKHDKITSESNTGSNKYETSVDDTSTDMYEPENTSADDDSSSEQSSDSKNNNSNHQPSEDSSSETNVPYTPDTKTDDEPNNISYDFEPIYLWNPYPFKDKITLYDLNYIKSTDLYDFKKFENKLDEIIKSYDNTSETCEDIYNKVENFDNDKKSNPDLLDSKSYYENAMDRLFLYKNEWPGNYLEQAAISAEGAVEESDINGQYDFYIICIQTGVVSFLCVLNTDASTYDSGSRADVQYRIGKLIYKPAANLKFIKKSEKFYSLCYAYVILGDALNNSDENNKYSVEIAYYYLKVCVDIIKEMPDSEKKESVWRQALAAYDDFEARGKANPDNATYKNYKTEDENMLQYLENL